MREAVLTSGRPSTLYWCHFGSDSPFGSTAESSPDAWYAVPLATMWSESPLAQATPVSVHCWLTGTSTVFVSTSVITGWSEVDAESVCPASDDETLEACGGVPPNGRMTAMTTAMAIRTMTVPTTAMIRRRRACS